MWSFSLGDSRTAAAGGRGRRAVPPLGHRHGGRSPTPHEARLLVLLGLLEDLDDPPALGGGQRPGLHQEDAVADTAGVLLVVGLVLGRTADDLAVQGVLDAVLDGDDDGLVHLVADDQALTGLAVVPRLGG